MRELWQNLRPWTRDALVLALFVTLLVAGCYCHYDLKCKCAAAPNEKRHEMVRWDCRFLDDPNAVFTAFGVFAVVAGFWYLRRQIEQGEENIQTAKAIRAEDIEAQRGKFLFVSAAFDETQNGVTCVFRNIGPSAIHVETLGVRYRKLAEGSTALEPPGLFIFFRETMNTYVIGGSEFRPDRFFPVPRFCQDESGKAIERFAVQFSIVYQTIGLRKHFACNWTRWGPAQFRPDSQYTCDDDYTDSYPTEARAIENNTINDAQGFL